MSKDKTLYLHIGTGKTGTTAIQKFCFENRQHLQSLGCRYSAVGLDYYAHHILGHLWGVGWMEPDRVAALREDADWQRVRDEFEHADSSLLVSTESLARVFSEVEQSLVDLQTILQGLKVTFIVYLRRQDTHVESWYNQLVKTGLTADRFDPFVRTPSFYDYYALLSRIRRYFPRADITVRVYEKSQFVDQSIFSDFLSTLGLGMDAEFVLPSADPNPRIGRNLLEYLRVANSIDRPWSEKYQFNQQLIEGHEISHFDGQSSEVLLTGEQRRRFLQRYEESNAQVAREFLQRSDGQLFLEPVDDLPEPEAYQDDAESILRLTVDLWRKQNDRIDALSRANATLQDAAAGSRGESPTLTARLGKLYRIMRQRSD